VWPSIEKERPAAKAIRVSELRWRVSLTIL
jgi:hypothetical protein